MSNIYEVLLQSIHISAICVIILILKWLFADKLSPKWQYGVWFVLIISILLPYRLSRYIIPILVLPFEIIKTRIEKGINSSFIGVYEPLNTEHIFPMIISKPTSITDWLFVIYVCGILAYLLWHLIAYIRLRLTLKKGALASNESLLAVRSKYNLKACKVVEVDGLESAFICGILNPILVIPKGQEIDEKIILHELLHLKYKDPMQNVFWCILRSLHWINPFMHYVFNRIANDMESLCDQRVLELLEGEERREYGNILLKMANNKYSRMAGTSSISNGGKNISRRIESIVRFKLFPKGMAIVSICSIIVLTCTILVMPTITYSQSEYAPPSDGHEKALAVTRLNRCTTVAGALDTYGKGIISKNILYIATASPIDRQAEFEKAILANHSNGNFINHYEVPEELDNLDYSLSILNLYKVNDEKYTAYINFVNKYDDSKSIYEESNVHDSILLPVEITLEDGWVVRETDEPIVYKGVDNLWDFAEYNYSGGSKVLRGSGETGNIEVVINNFCEIDNSTQNDFVFFGNYNSFNTDINVDAEFYHEYNSVRITYDSNNKTRLDRPKNVVKLFYKALETEDEEYEFPVSVKDYSEGESWNFYSQSAPGYTQIVINEDWDGILKAGDGSGMSGDIELTYDETPSVYVCRVLWDGKEMEDIIAKEVKP